MKVAQTIEVSPSKPRTTVRLIDDTIQGNAPLNLFLTSTGNFHFKFYKKISFLDFFLLASDQDQDQDLFIHLFIYLFIYLFIFIYLFHIGFTAFQDN